MSDHQMRDCKTDLAKKNDSSARFAAVEYEYDDERIGY